MEMEEKDEEDEEKRRHRQPAQANKGHIVMAGSTSRLSPKEKERKQEEQPHEGRGGSVVSLQKKTWK